MIEDAAIVYFLISPFEYEIGDSSLKILLFSNSLSDGPVAPVYLG